jgi:hypothetical protein
MIPEPQKCLNLHPMFDLDAFPIVMFSNVENAESSGIQIESLTNKYQGKTLPMHGKHRILKGLTSMVSSTDSINFIAEDIGTQRLKIFRVQVL